MNTSRVTQGTLGEALTQNKGRETLRIVVKKLARKAANGSLRGLKMSSLGLIMDGFAQMQI